MKQRLVEGEGLKSLGVRVDGCGEGEREGGGIPGQFSTSGIYEALRYAVMQKGILKLTKRPLVRAFLFFFFSSSKTSSSLLGTIFRRATDCFLFYEAFGVRFKIWCLVPQICVFVLSELKSEIKLVVS